MRHGRHTRSLQGSSCTEHQPLRRWVHCWACDRSGRSDCCGDVGGGSEDYPASERRDEGACRLFGITFCSGTVCVIKGKGMEERSKSKLTTDGKETLEMSLMQKDKACLI